jgi:hypothetical protein
MDLEKYTKYSQENCMSITIQANMVGKKICPENFPHPPQEQHHGARRKKKVNQKEKRSTRGEADLFCHEKLSNLEKLEQIEEDVRLLYCILPPTPVLHPRILRPHIAAASFHK